LHEGGRESGLSPPKRRGEPSAYGDRKGFCQLYVEVLRGGFLMKTLKCFETVEHQEYLKYTGRYFGAFLWVTVEGLATLKLSIED